MLKCIISSMKDTRKKIEYFYIELNIKPGSFRFYSSKNMKINKMIICYWPSTNSYSNYQTQLVFYACSDVIRNGTIAESNIFIYLIIRYDYVSCSTSLLHRWNNGVEYCTNFTSVNIIDLELVFKYIFIYFTIFSDQNVGLAIMFQLLHPTCLSPRWRKQI